MLNYHPAEASARMSAIDRNLRAISSETPTLATICSEPLAGMVMPTIRPAMIFSRARFVLPVQEGVERADCDQGGVERGSFGH
jgi:hypothetical protein